MLKVDQQRLVAEFTELIQIDSPSKHEREVVNYIKHCLNQLGLEVIEDDAGKAIGGNAGNLICRVPGTVEGSPSILLVVHMDTVESNHGVMPIISQNVIKTDGTTILGADDKAGVAAVIEALRQLKAQNLPHGPLEIVFTVAEEAGLLGVKALDYSKLQSRLGFAFDAGAPVGTVVTSAPGEEGILIKILGKEAHAGVNPDAGVNAIWVAGHMLSKFPMGKLGEGVSGNIGVISGGTATNVVPEQVVMHGEIRALRIEDIAEAVQGWQGTAHQVADQFAAQVEFRSNRLYQPFVLTEAHSTVQIAQRAIGQLDIQPELVARGGGSDTNIFNQQGIECVNFGIGVARNHSKEEYIPLEQLVLAAKLVLSVITCASEVEGKVD